MLALLLTGLVGLAASEPVASAPALETVHWSGRAPAAGGIEVVNPRGDLRLRGVDGEGVELLAQVQRLGSPQRQARVDVTPEGDRLVVRVSVPEGERSRAEDRVDLVLLVPRRVAVAARSGFGRLEARGLAGLLEAESESGELALELDGAARARSVSGRIAAHLTRAAMAAGVELESGAGGIRVELARDAEGAVEIRARDRVLVDVALPMVLQPVAGDARALQGRLGGAPGRLSIVADGEVQLAWARPQVPGSQREDRP